MVLYSLPSVCVSLTRGHLPVPFKCLACQLEQRGVDEDLRGKINMSILHCSGSRTREYTSRRLDTVPHASTRLDCTNCRFVHIFHAAEENTERLRAYRNVVVRVTFEEDAPELETNRCVICHAEHQERYGNTDFALCASCGDGELRWLVHAGDYFLVPRALVLTETREGGFLFTEDNEPVVVAVHTYSYAEWRSFSVHLENSFARPLSTAEIREFVAGH